MPFRESSIKGWFCCSSRHLKSTSLSKNTSMRYFFLSAVAVYCSYEGWSHRWSYEKLIGYFPPLSTCPFQPSWNHLYLNPHEPVSDVLNPDRCSGSVSGLQLYWSCQKRQLESSRDWAMDPPKDYCSQQSLHQAEAKQNRRSHPGSQPKKLPCSHLLCSYSPSFLWFRTDTLSGCSQL